MNCAPEAGSDLGLRFFALAFEVCEIRLDQLIDSLQRSDGRVLRQFNELNEPT